MILISVLSRAGIVDQLLAMNATLYLSGEVAYVPWTTAGTNMNYVDRMLMLTDDYFLVQVNYLPRVRLL